MKKIILLLVLLVGLPFKLNAQMTENDRVEAVVFIGLVEIHLYFILAVIFIMLIIRFFNPEPPILYYRFKFVNENESNINEINVKKYDIEFISNPVGFLTSKTEEIYKITTVDGKNLMINKKNIFNINKVYRNEKI